MDLLEVEGIGSREELVEALEKKKSQLATASATVGAKLSTKISELEDLLKIYDEAFSANPVDPELRKVVERMKAFGCADLSQLTALIEELETLAAKCSDFIEPKQRETMDLLEVEGIGSREELVEALEKKKSQLATASATVGAKLSSKISELEDLLKIYDEAFSANPVDPELKKIRTRMTELACSDSSQLFAVVSELEKIAADYNLLLSPRLAPQLPTSPPPPPPPVRKTRVDEKLSGESHSTLPPQVPTFHSGEDVADLG
jgi:phage shock protein A